MLGRRPLGMLSLCSLVLGGASVGTGTEYLLLDASGPQYVVLDHGDLTVRGGAGNRAAMMGRNASLSAYSLEDG